MSPGGVFWDVKMLDNQRCHVRSPVCCFLVTCLLWLMACCQVMAAESFPPLVPAGERFENIEALLANISRRSSVNGVAFSPQGDMLASGGSDGTVRLYIRKTAQLAWIFSGGQRGTWITCNLSQECWRYDDGTLLQRQEVQGTLTPIMPPAPAAKGELEIQTRPASLVTADGELTSFSLTLRNSGRGRVYWVNVVQDVPPGQTRGVILHPPPTLVIVEPGATVELPCQVSAPAERTNPQSHQVMLHLRITTAHDAPLSVEPIPVTTRTPSLQWIQALQKDKETLQIELRNAGKQDVSETEFQAAIASITLDKIVRPQINANEIVTLSFTLPASLPTADAHVTLKAIKLAHPVHEWNFPAQPFALPRALWPVYTLLLGLIVGSSAGVYYLRLYRHPLVTQLSAAPASLMTLPLDELLQAQRLLQRTGRLRAILATNAVPPAWLERAVAFARTTDPATRCRLLRERINAVDGEPVSVDGMALFSLHMPEDFVLNVDRCLLAFPPGDMAAAQQERVIQAEALDHAMVSQAVRRALAGWERVSNDEQANRLDRIIVYAAIDCGPFTLEDLMRLFDGLQYAYDPEQLKQSLARLELAFIIQQHQERYTFCVPLFTQMLQTQAPQLLLERELHLTRG